MDEIEEIKNRYEDYKRAWLDIQVLLHELEKYKGLFDYWICSWCGERFKKSEGVDRLAFHIVECKSNPLLARVKELEEQLSQERKSKDEWLSAYHPKVVELNERAKDLESQVGKLKMFIHENYPSDHWDLVQRVAELEGAISEYLSGWDKDGPNYNLDILESHLKKEKA